MDVKVNPLVQAKSIEAAQPAKPVNDDFKFMLTSNIAEKDLQARMQTLIEDIVMQGEKISKRKDIRDMKKYRGLIKEFLNEVVNNSHKFTRENFLDRKGRHRVYGIIRLANEALDELARELVKEEKDNISILSKIGEIRGLLLDIFT